MRRKAKCDGCDGSSKYLNNKDSDVDSDVELRCGKYYDFRSLVNNRLSVCQPPPNDIGPESVSRESVTADIGNDIGHRRYIQCLPVRNFRNLLNIAIWRRGSGLNRKLVICVKPNVLNYS